MRRLVIGIALVVTVLVGLPACDEDAGWEERKLACLESGRHWDSEKDGLRGNRGAQRGNQLEMEGPGSCVKWDPTAPAVSSRSNLDFSLRPRCPQLP